MYIKGLVNTKDQSNSCMCEMMSKGSKEALTVLIVTHVTHAKGVKRSLNSFTHNFLNIPQIFNPKRPFQPYHSMLCMSKGLKVILTFDPFDMLRHT